MQTSAWSRYASHRLCRDCYTQLAATWHDTLRRIAGERGGDPPPALPPDW